MRRRTFIAGLAGAAVWPVMAWGQQAAIPVQRVGMISGLAESDPEAAAQLSAFKSGLARLGWTEGSNLRIEVRWGSSDVDRLRLSARELVVWRPAVIFSVGGPATWALHNETQTIPVVFASVSDPVGVGLVDSLAHPRGNITGFVNQEVSMGSKWVELLTQIAPGTTQVAVMFNPETAPGRGKYFLPSFEAAARSLNVKWMATPVRTDAQIEEIIAELGRQPGSGLIATADTFTLVHRAALVSAATRNNLPAVYWIDAYVRDGGLLSYGVELNDLYRRAAAYVDRILHGEKPADLPVQLPVKFQMVLNLKTAKALGLTIPQSILLRADEVIE
jgi:putative tryptophan/tyrosine transport system substrate-binding protein